MLDLRDHSVWSNAFFLLPAGPAFAMGFLPGLVMLVVGGSLAYASGRYHTTYEREEQGEDAYTMLTYLTGLIGVILFPVIEWALLLPVVAAPLHRRFVWMINSYVAVPIYGALALGLLAFQTGVSAAVLTISLAIGGGAIKLYQPGPRSRLHSIWHFLGGLSAASALFVLLLYG